MKLKKIHVKITGYVHCHSCFYDSHDILQEDMDYHFFTGINRLYGEIDSGKWAISYLMSMYKYQQKDFILFEQPNVIANNDCISLNEFSQFSCYMDKLYPLFSTGDSVKSLVLQGLNSSKLNYSLKDIKDLFHIDNERFERPITGVGNEIFRVMSAIAYAYEKQVFCFPWLSKMRIDSYHKHLSDLLEILEHLDKIVILPIGNG